MIYLFVSVTLRIQKILTEGQVDDDVVRSKEAWDRARVADKGGGWLAELARVEGGKTLANGRRNVRVFASPEPNVDRRSSTFHHIPAIGVVG